MGGFCVERLEGSAGEVAELAISWCTVPRLKSLLLWSQNTSLDPRALQHSIIILNWFSYSSQVIVGNQAPFEFKFNLNLDYFQLQLQLLLRAPFVF